MNDRSPSGITELWVCFTAPTDAPPQHVLILSFMAPSTEADAAERWGGQVVSGRALIDEVRSRTRGDYVQLIARLGSTPGRRQQTLRQALQGPGGYSRWWLLPLTEKDCVWDADQTYTTMLRLTAIQLAKDRYVCDQVRLYGAPPVLAMALGLAPTRLAQSLALMLRVVARGVLERLALVKVLFSVWWTLGRLARPSVVSSDVLLQGYWDWSVRSKHDGVVFDRYFTDLPAQLARRGVSVGWLVTCETDLEPWQRSRRRRDVLAASCAHPEVTLLERHLAPTDVVRTVFDLRYPLRVMRFILDRRFRVLCQVGTFDLYFVVLEQLLRSAWGSTFCRLELVATATARACRQLRPRVVLTFMELLLRARAIYAGVSAASTGTTVWANQHAGYSSDKTLGVIDPEVEMRGVPDKCAIPAPAGVFVMGDLSRRIWQATGLNPTKVMVTGGLRYQSVRIRSNGRRVRPGRSVSVLLACGMNEAAELELCDAALAAARDLRSVSFYWRDHPGYQFSHRPAFRAFRHRIVVTSRTLDEDLEAADLVLFTHAGIAEEALVRGIPVWQWTWAGFNTSPFLDVPVIPSFSSVHMLRRAFENFLRDPAPFYPTAETQRRVLHECFGPDPSSASERVADAVEHMVKAGA